MSITTANQRWNVEMTEDLEESLSNNFPEMVTTEVDPSVALGVSGELPFDMSEWTAEELAAYNALRSKRKKCCIGGCTPRSLPIARSYHQLPCRNEEVWGKWVEVIRWSRNDPEWGPSGDAAPLVCSRHFPDSEFISYEASSRVRLSHTAIPVNYVDPPEGTVMDARFSNPLPLPPCTPNTKPKYRKVKPEEQQQEVDEDYERAQVQRNDGSHSYDDSSTSHNGDEYGYDIEEVQDECYDGMEEDQLAEENYYMTPQILYKPTITYQQQTNKHKALPNRPRLSAPPALTSFQGQKNLKRHNSLSKPPGLIRANFAEVNKIVQKPNASRLSHVALSGPTKTIVKNVNVNPVASRGNHPTKHKIGIEKCRLIVQTLDNQLKIAKMRLAEQLNIPYQVVQGVWNMRDTLKDKL